MRKEFTNTELRILWIIKRRRGRLSTEEVGNIYDYFANELVLSRNAIRASLRGLEAKCVVIRHFTRGTSKFADGGGGNPLLAVELVDPQMQLPPVDPIPLAVVVAKENDELAERTAHEPDMTQMLDALVDRCLELQQQIDKLGGIVVQLNEENEKLRKQGERKPPPEHLTARIREALTPEQWEKMRHDAK